jgi:uncharacterized protein (DUF1800 family)
MGINRRELLQRSSLFATALTLWGRGMEAMGATRFGLAEYQSAQPEIQLLNRFSFGIHPDDIELLRNLGPAGYLANQLDEGGPDPQVEAQVMIWFPSVTKTAAELKALVDNEQMTAAEIAAELKRATLYRAASSRYQLYEVMVDFWSNHFNIYHSDGPLRLLKTVDDREVIRANALTTFRELLHASAKSPAMLFYLDNYNSKKDGYNENYARELMELHTLGVDGGYANEDVGEVARILTGWSISQGRNAPGEFRFKRRFHDYGRKTVMSVSYPAGVGLREGEALLDQLADHPGTRHFIASKLCQRLLTDEPPERVVRTVEDAWGSDGDIKQMLLALSDTDEFYDLSLHKLRRPNDYLLAMLRTTATSVNQNGLRQINGALGSLGQIPFNYPSPTGYPDDFNGWASTSGFLNRWNIASLALGYRADSAEPRKASLIQPEQLVDLQATAEELVEKLVSAFLQGQIDTAGYQQLLEFTATRLADSTSAEIWKVIRDLANLIFASPYFQWH